ncbi:hypothetical protein B484DRAFT_445063 [Ochromonadaceae sp. CCMP2298]|nr:hypothetical protein B484DRAFT_445063 [Ochromonadaceae sp. CCMP2298]
MSYLDIDTILSEEERIPATFIVEAPGLGHLDNSIDSEDLPEQSRIEMPLWLAMAFAKRGMVTLELPKHFEKKMREEILAGAQNIDLREFSFYFFEVGSTLAVEMKNEDLRQSLQIAFAGERFRSLMTNSLSSWNDDLTEFAQNLTAAEAHILKEGECLPVSAMLPPAAPCCPLLPPVAHCCPLLPTAAHCCPLLPPALCCLYREPNSHPPIAPLYRTSVFQGPA